MQQIESVSVNAKLGTATLKWSPKFPFSYQLIDSRLRMIGVGLIGIYMRVRGSAIPRGNKIALSSIGDQTQFILISPISVKPGDYAGFPDGSKLSLSPKLKKKITEASAERKDIIVEGPLYQGHRAPPLYLMIDRLQIEKK